MRRLPGPADCRLSEGDKCSRGSCVLFRDWQRTLTQSSATALAARGSKWMSGSARAGTTSREAPARTTKPDITHCTFSRTRPGHLCSPLTEDSHGRRLYGNFGCPGTRNLQFRGRAFRLLRGRRVCRFFCRKTRRDRERGNDVIRSCAQEKVAYDAFLEGAAEMNLSPRS
jgi:hypothetical protein